MLGLTYRTGPDIVTNPARPNASDLDCLPFPARDTLPLVLTAGNAPLIYSSRGCNCRCEFCSVHKFYRSSGNGQWRGRSPKNVVDEMEEIANQFGIKEFAFADEQFMGHGRTGMDRALGIAEELLKRRLAFHWYVETRSSDVSLPVFAKLRKSGLRAVFMGLESGYIAGLMREGLELRERAEHARQQEIELGKKRQEVADLGRQTTGCALNRFVSLRSLWRTSGKSRPWICQLTPRRGNRSFG